MIADHPVAFLMSQSFVAIAIIASAGGFMRGRNWARRSLVLISWIFLVVSVSVAVLGAAFWISDARKFLVEAPGDWYFIVIGFVVGVVTVCGVAGPLVLLIRFLQSKAVRLHVHNPNSAIGTDLSQKR